MDLDTLFLYKIGEELTLKGMVSPFVTHPGRAPEACVAQKLVVIERQLTECPGGHQQQYRCRFYLLERVADATASKETFWFNETELVPYLQPTS